MTGERRISEEELRQSLEASGNKGQMASGSGNKKAEKHVKPATAADIKTKIEAALKRI